MPESQTHQQYLYKLCSTMPLQQCTTDTNGHEKKDQVLKSVYISYMAKLSIKHLFICYG